MSTSRRHFLRGMTSAATVSAVPFIPGTSGAAIQGSNRTSGATDALLWGQAWAKRFTVAVPNPLAPASIYKAVPGKTAEFEIFATQTTADILGVPGVRTTVWGYHNYETAPTFPGRTFEVTKGQQITVRWYNRLVNAAGAPLPHLLPIDQTITPQTSTTGVPLAVHHHGGDTAFEFDGGPDQWQTPVRKQTGPGITVNSAQTRTPQSITYVYDNKQEASMHWYHDHAEGITGVNVDAGLAGLYVVRDTNERTLRSIGRIPAAADEVALVLQDRTFNAAGELTYSTDRIDSPTELPPNFPAGAPTHMPEVFGDVIVVNGKAWPKMDVQPRKYRLRLLNGSDSRFFTLNFSTSVVPMWVIGTDLGFLNYPVKIGAAGLTIGPGERYDVVVDFCQAWWVGGTVDLMNSAVTPFPNGGAPSAGTAAVMRFNVNFSLWAPQPFVYLNGLTPLRGANGTPMLPAVSALPKPTVTRKILLGEGSDVYGRILPMIGVYDPTNAAKNVGTLSFQDPATETPKVGATEIWEIWNTTADFHPIHLHLVQFRIVNRQAFTFTSLDSTVMSNGASGIRLLPSAVTMGATTPPDAWEDGWKDTALCPPNSVTRIQMTFNRPGSYVYHCHILSHEDHDMMRWFKVI